MLTITDNITVVIDGTEQGSVAEVLTTNPALAHDVQAALEVFRNNKKAEVNAAKQDAADRITAANARAAAAEAAAAQQKADFETKLSVAYEAKKASDTALANREANQIALIGAADKAVAALNAATTPEQTAAALAGLNGVLHAAKDVPKAKALAELASLQPRIDELRATAGLVS